MNFEPVNSEQDDQIIIMIHEDVRSNLYARSVDFCIGPMKLRVSPRSDECLNAIFHRSVADHLVDICARAPRSNQIVNAPDFSLGFRDLAIKGYTLIVQTLESGLRQFIVTLKRASGNAMAIFGDPDARACGHAIGRVGHTCGGTSTSARLFDEMLAHLYLPLSNLNTFLAQAIDTNDVYRETGFGSSIVQLKTKAEVLQFAFDRLISEVMLEKYSPPSWRGRRHDGARPIEEQAHLTCENT